MRWIVPSLFALTTLACAEAVPPKMPETPANSAEPDPFKIDGTLREETFPLLKAPTVDPLKARLETAPSGLLPPPAECGAYVSRKGKGGAKCADKEAALAALDEALAKEDAAARDAALVDLEACAGLPGGTARALRIELAPLGCGDVMAEPWLKAPPPGANGTLHYAILGQAIAARLARAAQDPPKLPPPHDRKHVAEFVKGPMKLWFDEQARVIELIARDAAELPGYAKGVAAVEAGVADLRLVEAARGAPIPEEFARDAELKNAYYGSLDQWLDPRKDRGRDAALVGLKELALAGVIRDGRVDRARALLSKMYGGRRIDALDGLLLPPLAAASPASIEERLAAKLPTLYAGLLLDEKAASRAGTVRMLLGKGLPAPQRAALAAAAPGADAQALYARGRLELARLYLRSVDVDRAIAALTAGKDAPLGDEATFTLALAIALRNGPEDAADMMRKAPRALSLGQVGALDALAKKGGKHAALAAFDAAMVREIAAPEGADVAYWRDVAKRFQAAAGLLTDPAQRAAAADRGKAAEAIAEAAAGAKK